MDSFYIFRKFVLKPRESFPVLQKLSLNFEDQSLFKYFISQERCKKEMKDEVAKEKRMCRNKCEIRGIQ